MQIFLLDFQLLMEMQPSNELLLQMFKYGADAGWNIKSSPVKHKKVSLWNIKTPGET